MQEDSKTNQTELTKFIRWVTDNYQTWSTIAGFNEIDDGELPEILKSLYENELHILFLTVIEKNRHTRTMDKIIDTAIWDTIENTVNHEMIKQLEANILQKFEQA